MSWSGIDETIVEKVAEENGRSAWTPFINTDQGDLLLFVFLLAGIAGGFIVGYCWHKLFARPVRNYSESTKKNDVSDWVKKEGIADAKGSI